MRNLPYELARSAAERGENYNTPNTRKLLAMLEDRMRGVKMIRKAYVCEGGQVQHINDLGYSTLTDAFIARPKKCKYCVFEMTDGRAMLVNMFELTQSGNQLELTVKEGTTQVFATVDVAIMYALTID